MRSWITRRRRYGEATCEEVAQALQSYLDGQVDELTARRVGRHLEQCRRCGLELETYQAIKASLARRSEGIDVAARERLRAFGEGLARGSEPGESSA